MNSNTGISILTAQEVIKAHCDENELQEISDAYDNVKEEIKYKKPFNEMNLKDYKSIISKIDKKLKKEKFDETTNQKLKNARRKILVITSPPSRFIHIDSVFID